MMSAAEYISEVDDFVVPFLPSHPHHSEMEKERDGLCFICDSVTNNESVQLQFGQTTHSKTGLPIKLGQLIGDDFMVIVSVNDRLCFACIKLINLADKLEIELNIVKKVITGHLKSKYQLSDENDVGELISVSKNDVCDILVDNSNFEVTESSEVNVGVEMHDELLNDFNKTDCQTEEMCVVNESDSDVEIIEEASSEKTNECIKSSVKISSTSSSPTSLLLKQSAVGSCHNSFTIKDTIKEDSGNVKIAENKSNLLLNNNSNDVINVDCKNTINNNIQIKKEIICDRIISDKNINKLKANKCSVNRPVFKCTMCDEAFHTQVLLRKHIMNSHLNKWSCYFCSITFNNDNEYQKHMKMHIKNVKLQSQMNSDKNLSESNLSDNGNNSSLDFDNQNEVKTFFKCKNCKFKTKFNFLLDKHQFECCATNSSASSSSTSLNDIKNKNVIKCQSCLTIFKNKKQLNLHVCSAAVKNNNNTDDSNNCSDGCVTSNNTFENKCSKSCKYKCGICSLTFNIKNSLIKHLRSHKISNVNKTNNTSTKLCNKILDYSTTKDDSTTEIIQVDVDLNTNDYDNDISEIHLSGDDDDDDGGNNDVDNDDENMTTNTLLLRCGICSLTFDKQSTYIEHTNFHKNNNKKIITNNESAPEIYFDNVEHFMALSSESSSINLSSDKENSLNLNYNINKNITDISLTDKKIDHCDGDNDDNNDNNDNVDNENDHDNKINLITNFSCSTCNISFSSKNDLDKHATLYDHKLNQNFNDFKYNNLIKTDNNNGLDNKHFIDTDTNKILDNKNNISIIESQFVNEIIINTLNTSVQNNSSNSHCSVNKSISNEVSSSNIKNLSCQQCTYTGTSINDLKDHENIDHSVLNDMITCNICDKYIDKSNENEHYNSHKTIYCNYCSFETKNKKLMSKHIKEHNNKNNNRKDRQDYLCQYCSETFKTKKLLKSHEELHPENFEFHCNECNKKFMKEKQLKNHYDEVHRDPHCYYCGKEIFNLKALKNHEQRHVRDLHNSNKLECDICKRVFKTRTGLRHHFAIHTGKFKYFCDFCQRGFMSRMMLEEHRSCHTKEDRYVCDVCGRKFTFQSTYWIHRKWHDNPFPYKCNFCGRLFRHTSLLAVHKRKHTGERPYKCPHCPLSFTVGGTLKRHLILHTQKFPFTCDTCKRGFTTKHKYSVHLAKMHNNYELLNNKKSLQKQTDFKMVIKEKSLSSPRNTDVSTENEKLSTTSREPPDNFEFIPDTTNFTLVNMEEDDTGNSAVMMPCIMTTVNNEENNGLVFEIISGSPLQQMSSGIALPENTMLPDMWCQ